MFKREEYYTSLFFSWVEKGYKESEGVESKMSIKQTPVTYAFYQSAVGVEHWLAVGSGLCHKHLE